MAQRQQNRLSTANCREEATSTRVGRVETQSGARLTHGTVHGRIGHHGHGERRGTDHTPGASDLGNYTGKINLHNI